DHLATRGRGFNPRERSWNFTNPWPGGRWTLRDIVSYQTDAAYALLEHAARYRDIWLANFLTVEGRAVRGWHSWPYAYVLPRQQRDTVGLATLLGILERGQVEIRTALHPIALGGQRYAAGSYVVVLRQPYAAFAKALLEPQRYPDLRLYPGGPPLPPYDVTAHTLPLLMGVTAVAAPDSLRIGLSAPGEPPVATPAYGRAGARDALPISCCSPCAMSWKAWPTTSSTRLARSSGSSSTLQIRSRAACRRRASPGTKAARRSRCSTRAPCEGLAATPPMPTRCSSAVGCSTPGARRVGL